MSTKSTCASEAHKSGSMTTSAASPSENFSVTMEAGPTPFVGTENAFYERHLLLTESSIRKWRVARERFEACLQIRARHLAQRWVQTKKTYDGTNAKRIYYLSMGILIGRSLANNVTNLLLDPMVQHAVQEKVSTGLNCSSRNQMLVSQRRLGRLAACFSTRWPRCSFQRWVMVCATSTACLNSPS